MKRKVYFFESNIPMDQVIYLPFVSGILHAYAKSFRIIDERFEFMPYIFMRDTPERMIINVENPSVMAFSVCIWNHKLSLAVAELVKKKWPYCQIIFGGPQVSKKDLNTYPFINRIIEEEGEKKFVNFLASLIDFELFTLNDNLQSYPSPYTLGLYERTIKDYPNMQFQAIVETNRGCPFTCSFCYWGQGFEEKKVRHHTLEHIREEAEWLGQNKIKYIFMADANFGMYDRDYEVAKIYCETKEKYGFPDKIRVCYGKNKEENVFRVATLMHSHALTKAVTLARQSNNEEALKNIRRSNIKLSVYDSLRERYNQVGIPTYTEIILGMPGETKESFIKGLDEIAGTPTQLFVYHCTILPNTEMNNPDYIFRHGIKIVRVPLAEIHGQIRNPAYVEEFEDIVIETATMCVDDWIECAVYAWTIQLIHVFGINKIPEWVYDYFHRIAVGITKGKYRAQINPVFGNIYWEPEEMAYLIISLTNGDIKEDPMEFSKKNILWGRKSKVHNKTLNKIINNIK